MKKILISVCMIVMASLCFAIPGVETNFPMTSGEYVYYKDYTFPRETYIGFLQYDESTIALRYYAENPEAGSNDITIYLTLNPESDFVDMTGEKIVGVTSADDTDTLNYLHDVLYEFAGRRKKLNGSDFSSTVRLEQDYVQFGGYVTMVFDDYVPIFNLSQILNDKGDKLFELEVIGTLSDSSDTSFTDFKGCKNLPNFNAKYKKKDLSKKWTSYTDEIKFLDEDAVMLSMYVDLSETKENLAASGIDASWFMAIAKMNFATPSVEIYAPSISFKEDDKKSVLKYLTYNKESDSYVYQIEMYTKESDNVYKLDSISAYGDFYYANKKYFDKLVK